MVDWASVETRAVTGHIDSVESPGGKQRLFLENISKKRRCFPPGRRGPFRGPSDYPPWSTSIISNSHYPRGGWSLSYCVRKGWARPLVRRGRASERSSSVSERPRARGGCTISWLYLLEEEGLLFEEVQSRDCTPLRGVFIFLFFFNKKLIFIKKINFIF